jgi:hypothetical protein
MHMENEGLPVHASAASYCEDEAVNGFAPVSDQPE